MRARAFGILVRAILVHATFCQNVTACLGATRRSSVVQTAEHSVCVEKLSYENSHSVMYLIHMQATYAERLFHLSTKRKLLLLPA